MTLLLSGLLCGLAYTCWTQYRVIRQLARTVELLDDNREVAILWRSQALQIEEDVHHTLAWHRDRVTMPSRN
jgi:hypothetical protein